MVLAAVRAGAGLSRRADRPLVGLADLGQIGLWVVWFLGFVALLAPSTVALTIVRIAAPAGPVVLLVAALFGTFSSWVVAGCVFGALVALVILLPTTGDPMINGSSYGPERRMALKPPASALLGPLQMAWALAIVSFLAGPVLLATDHLVLGVLLTAVGVPLGVRLAVALHQLSRRWVVFVPAGFVVHDYWSMAESMLVQRRLKPTLGPSPDDLDDAVDLTAGAMGLALAVEFNEPVPFALKKGRTVITKTSKHAIFAPSLPGTVLVEARIRGITIA
ncbi:MAG: hypothetical protein R2706_00215 [Acidimicrobiales bacterium]